jgi:diguanylate cyclase (GGDEF)-like protein
MNPRAFLRELQQTAAQRSAWKRALQIVAELQACVSSDEAYDIIVQGAQKLFPATSGVLYVRKEPGDFQVEAVGTWGKAPQPETVFKLHQCQALRFMKVVEYTQATRARQATPVCQHVGIPGGGTYVCVPLMAEGQASGLLHFRIGGRGRGRARLPRGRTRPRPPRGLTSLEKQLASELADQSALTLRNLHKRKELEERATRDSLTGLYNWHFMQDSLERELARAVRNKATVGIIMLDIDHFKQFNTKFGWLGGNALLRDFGRFLQQQIRGEDIACRYGGEEFVLILPGASLDVTRKRAVKLKEAVKHLTVRDEETVLDTVTLSLGVAAYPRHGTTSKSLLRAVSEALSRAKATGRDRVVVAPARQSVCGG